MKKNNQIIISSLSLLLFVFLNSCGTKQVDVYYPQKIDIDWQFHLGDVENGQIPDLSTTGWRTIDLPHDWSIEGSYGQGNGTDWQSGFLPAGIGWYRKILKWEPSWKNHIIKIYFEGIYLNSDVWVNGHLLGHRPNGYISFEYDLTPFLTKGNNVIAVRVDHSKPLSGRWYTGSGIYRHVWLKIQKPVHIDNWGVNFGTNNVSKEKSTINVGIDVINESTTEKKVQVTAILIDKGGNEVFRQKDKHLIGFQNQQNIRLTGEIAAPKLWTPESPYLYTLKIIVSQNENELDVHKMKVGIRKIEFGANFGFKLNGEITKLKGVCDHHTAGSVGAAVPDDVWLYKLKLLKEMGCNAIRTAHNPFSPAFYNICDSLGIMVLDEFLDGWGVTKAKDDYGLYFEEWWKTDGIAFIKRDRNHPSVILWSIGNEVFKGMPEEQKQLVDLFHQYDPTRLVTQGGYDPTREMKEDNLPIILDVKGFNGNGEEKGVLEDFHTHEPQMPMICTEVPHTYQTRGVYRTKTHWRRRDFPAMWEKKNWDGTLRGLEKRLFPIPDLTKEEVFPEEKSTTWYKNGEIFPIEIKKPYQYELYYQSSYDNASVRSSARLAWQRTRDLDYVAGQFRWGSFDYLGESNDWPSRFANFGVIDICGFPKDHFYLYKSMWTEQPMVHILPHWTHPGKEGTRIPVVVYTNCEEVELFLNGESFGSQKYNDEQLVWEVVYQPGTLRAIAKKDGKVVAEAQKVTAGNAAQIKLSANRLQIKPNSTDVVYIAADIIDEKGVFCPMANNVIKFKITGPAKIIGIDNGDPLDLSGYKTNIRRAFRGKVMLLIQATDEPGNIEVEAKSNGLRDHKLNIISKK